MNIRRDVHLLVLDTFSDWEPGLAIAHINHPTPGGPSRYRMRTVGLSRGPIRSRGGLNITPDLTLAELRPEDSAMLILPGADTWADVSTDPALEKAREFLSKEVPVAAICGATFGLARSGVLDHCRHTSNDPDWLASSGYAGREHYVREPAVDDQRVITASAMACLEFARLILARLAVFPPKALEAWYGLFKTYDPACYAALTQALETESAS